MTAEESYVCVCLSVCLGGCIDVSTATAAGWRCYDQECCRLSVHVISDSAGDAVKVSQSLMWHCVFHVWWLYVSWQPIHCFVVLAFITVTLLVCRGVQIRCQYNKTWLLGFPCSVSLAASIECGRKTQWVRQQNAGKCRLIADRCVQCVHSGKCWTAVGIMFIRAWMSGIDSSNYNSESAV